MADASNNDSVEIWKPIPGWEGLYEASSEGRIRSVARHIKARTGMTRKLPTRVLRGANSRGYRTVVLHKDGIGKSYLVHRLVCEAFHGPCPDGLMVAHTDGTRSNNVPSNLRWATAQENSADTIRHGRSPKGVRHHFAKLSEDDIMDIRRRRGDGETLVAISERYKVDHSTIWQISKRKTWSHI